MKKVSYLTKWNVVVAEWRYRRPERERNRGRTCKQNELSFFLFRNKWDWTVDTVDREQPRGRNYGKETPRRRITVTSSLIEISTDQCPMF
jgi:hypothetical protein